jgi:two-component system, sensor histidine kinase and response regulator
VKAMSKVLIVEDERIIANDIKTTLNHWGHDTLSIVSTAEDALQSIAIKRPDIVLMDIKLKGKIDGIETGKRIKEQFNIPVIYLTAHADDAMIKRAKLTQPFGYIVKPFEEKSLHAAIEMATYKNQMMILDEQKLKKTSENLLRSNEELELFAIVAAHDLKEPLMVINNYVQLLREKYKNIKLDRSSENYMKRISGCVAQMSNLINSLLAYSKVDKSGISFKKINTTSCLKKALTNLKVIIKDSNAQVTYDQLPVILGDTDQIIRLFQNLIANSIKFRGEKTAKIHIANKSNDHEWIISVSDNGIGIKEENFNKIFDLFERLDDKSDFEGRGIGLSICKRIVERHGGHISVKSKFGKGSIFTFTIPMKPVK